MTKTEKSGNRPVQNSSRNASRRRDLLIGYIAQIVAVCVLMMWSVMNIVHNFWAIVGTDPNQQGGEPNWTVAIVMTLVLGVVPFLLSIFWLYVVVRKTNLN